MSTIAETGRLYRGREIPERFTKMVGRYSGRDARANAEAWAIYVYVSQGEDAAVVTVTMDGDGPLDDNWAPGSYVFIDPSDF